MKQFLKYFLIWLVILGSIGVFVLYGSLLYYLIKNNQVSYINEPTYNKTDNNDTELEKNIKKDIESEFEEEGQVDITNNDSLKEQSLLSHKDFELLESLKIEKEEDLKYLKESIYDSLKDNERFKVQKILELEEKEGKDSDVYYELHNLIGVTKYMLNAMLNGDIERLEEIAYIKSNLPKLFEKVEEFKPYKDKFGEFVICPLLKNRVYLSYIVDGKVKVEASIDFVKTKTNFYFSHLNF